VIQLQYPGYIPSAKKAEEKLGAREERSRSYIEVTGQLAWTRQIRTGRLCGGYPLRGGNLPAKVKKKRKGSGWTNALHPDDVKHTVEVWNKAVAQKRIMKWNIVYADMTGFIGTFGFMVFRWLRKTEVFRNGLARCVRHSPSASRSKMPQMFRGAVMVRDAGHRARISSNRWRDTCRET